MAEEREAYLVRYRTLDTRSDICHKVRGRMRMGGAMRSWADSWSQTLPHSTSLTSILRMSNGGMWSVSTRFRITRAHSGSRCDTLTSQGSRELTCESQERMGYDTTWPQLR